MLIVTSHMKQSKKQIEDMERQRKFRGKMYAAGFKQVQIWVRRSPKKRESGMDQKTFIKKLEKLTTGMSESNQSLLYSLFLQIAEAKRRRSELET